MAIYATNNGAKAIFLFIAEILGYRTGTEQGKLERGQLAYVSNELLNLQYWPEEHIYQRTPEEQAEARKLAEEDRAQAFENIWLQRLYQDLDKAYGIEHTANIYKHRVIDGRPFDSVFAIKPNAHQWTVPIELDAGASMLQYIGVLTNDKRILTMTNMIGSPNLVDPWSCDGIPRALFKHAATPRLYGSSQAVHEIWQEWGHSYTLEQLSLMNQQFSGGAIGVADRFKDFIINNVSPRTIMNVRIWGENFDIECNRFRQVGTETRKYKLYDSTDKRENDLHHTITKAEPDLEQFRRYFVTLLIHHLDSRVANTVIGKYTEKYGSGIDIYDAFIINPEAALDVRTWYAEELEAIHRDRKTILSEFFSSIGISGNAQGEWERFMLNTEQLDAPFKCRHMALK